VAEDTPLRMICVSMTAVSTGRPEPIGDDGGDFVLREIACALACALDQGSEGSELVVREVAERGVDLGEACAGRQQHRQDLTGELSESDERRESVDEQAVGQDERRGQGASPPS
jgi:hypothetical protein